MSPEERIQASIKPSRERIKAVVEISEEAWDMAKAAQAQLDAKDVTHE